MYIYLRFLSTVRLPKMDTIGELEEALGQSIVASNQNSLWAALNMIGVPAHKHAPERLFDGMRRA